MLDAVEDRLAVLELDLSKHCLDFSCEHVLGVNDSPLVALVQLLKETGKITIALPQAFYVLFCLLACVLCQLRLVIFSELLTGKECKLRTFLRTLWIE